MLPTGANVSSLFRTLEARNPTLYEFSFTHRFETLRIFRFYNRFDTPEFYFN
jgi:hypothetical protein